MKEHIDRLHDISNKPARRIIGLMSGTSLDGLDVAVCRVSGNGAATNLRVEKFKTVIYDTAFRNEILTIFSKKNTDLEKVCLLNKWIANRHAQMINDCLVEWQIDIAEIDLIASHGQTIYHAPLQLHQDKKFGNATLQIGDGDYIAMKSGIITISDFRQKHVAAGGEGAPLAAYGDMILFGNRGIDTILLNIGGVANFTFLSAIQPGKMISTDAGPGNNLMDAWMQKNYAGTPFDKDAALAKQGNVIPELLIALMDDPFFDIPFPRTTGPELFNLSYLENAIERSVKIKPGIADIMATLNAFTASVICESIKKIIQPGSPLEIFISGGGIQNPLVIDYIKDNIPEAQIQSTEALGIDPEAKEAILFALLANECVAGDANTFTNYFPNVSMGKISFPG